MPVSLCLRTSRYAGFFKEREESGVGSIPVAKLPPCQDVKEFALFLHKYVGSKNKKQLQPLVSQIVLVVLGASYCPLCVSCITIATEYAFIWQ